MMAFNHPLVAEYEEVDYGEEAVELAEQVRLGNEEAREKLILGYIKLVMHKVESWLAVFPPLAYLSDDMVSEGFLAVTKAVNKIAEGDLPAKNNPTGYVSVAIHNSLSDYVTGEAIIRVPKWVGPEQRASVSPRVFSGLESATMAGVEHERLLEVKDTLTSICETEYDAVIIELRSHGCTDAEIAEQLELPPTTVYMLRRELYERFQDAEKE